MNTNTQNDVVTHANDNDDAQSIDATNDAHNVTHDVVNDDNDATTTTTTTRQTTRAIRNLRDNARVVNVPDTTTRAKIVATSSGQRRIDHTNCTHERAGVEGKRARAKCRANVERAIANNAKLRATK